VRAIPAPFPTGDCPFGVVRTGTGGGVVTVRPVGTVVVVEVVVDAVVDAVAGVATADEETVDTVDDEA